jgi:hypothetical protein
MDANGIVASVLSLPDSADHAKGLEASRHYTLEPFSKLDVFENPSNIFFEGPSRLINDDTGQTVGVAVTESMDVRIMQNAPYAANQH